MFSSRSFLNLLAAGAGGKAQAKVPLPERQQAILSALQGLEERFAAVKAKLSQRTSATSVTAVVPARSGGAGGKFKIGKSLAVLGTHPLCPYV